MEAKKRNELVSRTNGSEHCMKRTRKKCVLKIEENNKFAIVNCIACWTWANVQLDVKTIEFLVHMTTEWNLFSEFQLELNSMPCVFKSWDCRGEREREGEKKSLQNNILKRKSSNKRSKFSAPSLNPSIVIVWCDDVIGAAFVWHADVSQWAP